MIPFYFQGNTTKENIIEILTEKWPLTAKKIYRTLTKTYHISLTYQAAYKALQELTENKILEKRKTGYIINKEWIKRLGQFSEKMKSDLESVNKKRISKTMQKITFDQHVDFIKFNTDFIEKLVKKEKKANLNYYFRHVPYPHTLSKEDIEKLEPIFHKIRWTIMAKSATLLDKWCAKQWRRLGIKVKIGCDIPTDTMLFVMNDYIMSLYLPKKAVKEWDKIFSIKSLYHVNMDRMTKTLLSKKFKTIVTVTKDKELAQQLIR